MSEEITINVIATPDTHTSLALGSITLLNSLIRELQDQGVLTEEAVAQIYDRAIDALATVDAENFTEEQQVSQRAAALLRGLAPGD